MQIGGNCYKDGAPPPERVFLKTKPLNQRSTLFPWKLDQGLVERGYSYVDQLRVGLAYNAVRIVEVLREWDTNGDGVIARGEFRRALRKLGCEAPAADIDAIFDSWDVDSSGVRRWRSNLPT